MHVLADIERLQEKIKKRLSWTDTTLLRQLLMFVETRSWQEKDPSSDEGNIEEIKAAVECFISVFRAPLESRDVVLPQFRRRLRKQ